MFFKNLVTLFSGTAVAQLIPLIALPFLTRLYSPSDFGQYGLFVAIVAIGAVFSTLRFDLAIAQANTDEDSSKLLVNTIALCFSISIVILLISLNISEVRVRFNIIEQILIALSIFSLGAGQSITYYNNRDSKFKLTAKAKVFQATSGLILMLCLSGFSSLGLILGHVIGQVTFVALSILKSRLKVRTAYKLLSLSILTSNKEYAFLSAPGSVLNTIFLHLPTVQIKNLYDDISLGYFSFVTRYVAGPLSLLSVATSQALLRELVHGTSSQIKMLVNKITLINIAISIVFVIFTFSVGEWLIVFALGSNWAGMSIVLKVLSFSIAIRFIVSPLSVVLSKRENLKLGLQWQLLSFIALGIFLISFQPLEFLSFLEAFVILDCILYLIYYVFIRVGILRAYK